MKIIKISLIFIIFFVLYISVASAAIALTVTFNASNYGGEFRGFRNGDLVSDSYFGHNSTVNFSNGDIISMVISPYDGFAVDTLCDSPYTECLSVSTYVSEVSITENMTISMIVTYKLAPTTYMPVVFSVIGQGQLFGFRNGELVASASRGFNSTGVFQVGDVIAIIAQPDQNNSLTSLCDVPYTNCSNITNNIYEVTGILPYAMVATFTSHNYQTQPDFEIPEGYDTNGSGTYSTIPNGTGFDELLKDDGLCATGVCHAWDLKEWLDRHINDFWILSFGLVLYRFWSM